MFDSVIAETAERFNLDGKAETLFSRLSALLTEDSRGGLKGFAEKFHQIGLTETFSSWTNSGANMEISNSQLESALGKETIDDIAKQSGIDYETAVSASAFMIPRLVDTLTPDGFIPEDKDLHSKFGGFMTGSEMSSITTEETFDRIGTAAAPILDADKKNDDINAVNAEANPVVDRVNADIDRVETNLDSTAGNFTERNESPLAWILPLLLLGLLLILGYWFCSKPPSAAETNTVQITPIRLTINAT